MITSLTAFNSLSLSILILFFAVAANAQKAAVFAPDKSAVSVEFAEKLSDKLGEKLKIPDASLSETALRSVEIENVFNLSLDESKNIGAVVGCDFFILIKGAVTRRESLDKAAYFETYAVVYLVSSRTGKLVLWQLKSFRADTPEKSKVSLFNSIKISADEIDEKIQAVGKKELNETSAAKFAEIPDENSADAANFRAPIPYRRIKPEYPAAASFYSIKATIDVAVEIDADGKIVSIETRRWAGFGLEESVAETIRKMNWRPAMRGGKPLATSVLLRYNFKKVEKEEQ